MFDRTHDARVRSAAFDWLSDQVARHGDVLPRTLLAAGFVLDGVRVPLLGPQGIFKPQVLHEVPLSITTAPEGPYDDAFAADGLLRYRYRGRDPNHPDNQALRAAKRLRKNNFTFLTEPVCSSRLVKSCEGSARVFPSVLGISLRLCRSVSAPSGR